MLLHWQACTDGGCWRRLRARRAGPGAVLSHFEVHQAPADVEALVRAVGVQVVRVAQPGWFSASRVEADGRAFFWLDAALPACHQRWALAFHLGHLLRHEVGREWRNVVYNATPEDVEAGKFAARLVVPLWLLELHAEAHGARVLELARDFGVPTVVMEWRMAKLVGAA